VPEKYAVQLRYRILAARDQHIARYRSLVEHLERVGFEFEPADRPATDAEDFGKNVFTGFIKGRDALKLLNHDAVASLVLIPADYKFVGNRVLVQLELASGLSPERQIDLASQATAILEKLGFRESIAYDHRGYTGRPHSRLRGTIPAGQLDVLLRDLRGQPSGWFAPRLVRENLPSPIRDVSPVLIAEVLPDDAPPAPFPPPEEMKGGAAKVSADLLELVRSKDKDKAEAVRRVEIILAREPAASDSSWRQLLRRVAPGLELEGRLGPVVTVTMPLPRVEAVAELPIVSVVRLPRAPTLGAAPGAALKGDDAKALQAIGIGPLHERGCRGKGVRLAVIDGDFRGVEAQIKAGKLPASTRVVDLTAHRNPTLQPDAYPGDPAALGHGTHSALAAALAAPEAEIVLVRIDPAAPYMMEEAASMFRGDYLSSPSLTRRMEEDSAAAALMRLRLAELLAERRIIAENFDDESDIDVRYGFLGPVKGWLFSERQWHHARMDEYERDVAARAEAKQRLDDLLREVQSLRGTQVVTTPLVWNEGYPLGGRSALSRALGVASTEELPDREGGAVKCPAAPLWFVAAGNTQGQVWNGLLRDADGTGALEFAAPGAALPKSSWSSELNFLGWEPFAGPRAEDLPAGQRFRISMQWVEPHDPAYSPRPGEKDLYANPLALMRLVVLRQRDPAGAKLPADEFEVVALTPYGQAQRLESHPSFAVYESSIEFDTGKGGRFALRVERVPASVWALIEDSKDGPLFFEQITGLAPSGVRPAGVPNLPALEKRWDLTPRLFVQSAGAAEAATGRPVFRDFATSAGTVGTPADSRALVAVGAAGPGGKAEPFSAAGPPPGLALLVTPRILVPDRLDLGVGGKGPAYGTSLSAPLAAGAAASLLSAGWTRDQLFQLLRTVPPGLLRPPARH
jgi:subtilisin family serine protease